MKQKHHLLTMLKEAYSIFYIENPNIKIGFSKFCDLWPQKKELMQDVPHSACLYSYHESVRLLLVPLSRYNKTKATEFHEFVVKSVCHSWERGPNQPTLHLVGWSHILTSVPMHAHIEMLFAEYHAFLQQKCQNAI